MSLKETDLRSHVLIPLFKKMGFKDVDHYHGVNERGKDITMWNFDEIESRRNHVVVVKAGKISGQANSRRSSAQNAVFQIQQCFAHPFVDKNSGDQHTAHHCWVVTNGEISTEARDTMQAVLKNTGYAQSIKFVGIDKLMEMMDKYFPQIPNEEKLREALQPYQTFSKHWAIDISIQNGQIQQFIRPKHDRAHQEQPIVLNGHFIFPDTPDGQRFRQEYEDFHKKGTTLHVKKGFFEGFDAPDFIKPYLFSGDTPEGIILIPLLEHTEPLDIRIEYKNSQESIVLRTKLKPVRVGTEEAILNNEIFNDVFKLQMHVTSSSKECFFTIKKDYTGANVKKVLDAYIFLRSLQNTGQLTITDENTNTVLFTSTISRKEQENTYIDEMIEVYEALVLIQKEFATVIVVPNYPIPTEEYLSIIETAEIIRNGYIAIPFTSFTMTSNRDSVIEILETFKNETPLAFATEKEEQEKRIFGKLFNLGRYTEVTLPVRVTVQEEKRLRKLIEKQEDSIDVCFTPMNNAPLYIFYEKWYKEAEKFDHIHILNKVISIRNE